MLDDDRVAGLVAEHRLTEHDAVEVAEDLAHRAFRADRDA
jgi:hypothetical protein